MAHAGVENPMHASCSPCVSKPTAAETMRSRTPGGDELANNWLSIEGTAPPLALEVIAAGLTVNMADTRGLGMNPRTTLAKVTGVAGAESNK
jgi:hypothetical protein